MLRILQRIVDILFPFVCLACGCDLVSSAQFPVCTLCQSKMKPVRPLWRVRFAAAFDGPMRALIHSYKYEGKEYLSRYFGELCATRWEWNVDAFDAVVAVPLPFWREARRGHNPAELLARELGLLWGKPVWTRVLRRRSGFPSQTRLGRRARATNARASFGLGRNASAIVGRRVLLIDDVFTTGATLFTCAELLKKAGAREVMAATIAYEPLQR